MEKIGEEEKDREGEKGGRERGFYLASQPSMKSAESAHRSR